MKTVQGAEAIVSFGKDYAVKERNSKSYRVPEIDAMLRKRRTRAEARMLREAKRNGVDAPYIMEESEFSLKLEKIEGARARDMALAEEISSLIGKALAKLHSASIIHGDFTTSNMIFSHNRLYIIDFGLAFFSSREEDKANDLYLLRENLRALVQEKAWKDILKAYESGYGEASKVIKTLLKIEKRRRYKSDGIKK